MTAKKLYSLQYSGAEWCITLFRHTQCTLCWNQRPLQFATVCGYMKVAISASTEAFLCQKSKKEQHQQVVHLLTYSFPN